MNKDQFDDLFSAYLAGACSGQQLALLLETIQAPENKGWVLQRIRHQLSRQIQSPPVENAGHPDQTEQALDENLQRIFQRISAAEDYPAVNNEEVPAAAALKKTTPFHALRWLAGSAAVLALFAAVFWWNHRSLSKGLNPQIAASVSTDFTPGKNAAVLTVDGGREIYLDSNQASGPQLIARQGNSAVTTDNGRILYRPGKPVALSGSAAVTPIYNTLRTSNGNQYSLVLPDGSKVWLNAASSIRFPVAFNGPNREVEVTGELYFEVKHNDRQPFIVMANGHEIEDIGTSFNVHSYAEEHAFSTTLIAGAVKVGGTVLKPGTQALIRDGQLTVRQADTSQVVAWKNGLFAFHQTPVKEVMRQIARWYDVEVSYAGEIPALRFGGKISRNSNASVVLTILKKSGLVFKVEGRKIIVTGVSQP